MPRDYRVCLEDILQCIERVRDYATGLTRDGLLSDRRTLDAVVRNLEVIGEAVKGLPNEVRAGHPEAEWQKIAGLRDILIHQYFGIDVEIIWDVIQNKLPGLERLVREMLS